MTTTSGSDRRRHYQSRDDDNDDNNNNTRRQFVSRASHARVAGFTNHDNGVGCRRRRQLMIGFCGAKIREHLKNSVIYAEQTKRLGTAHAVMAAESKIPKAIEDLLVVMGDDSAFYDPKTIIDLVELHRQKSPSITMLTVQKKDPKGLGRILRDETQHVTGIVEEKLATPAEKKIKEVNAACYVFKTSFLWPALKKIKRNPTGEYFLTDLIQIANKEGRRVIAHKISSSQWKGINTPEQLLAAHKAMAQRLKKK